MEDIGFDASEEQLSKIDAFAAKSDKKITVPTYIKENALRGLELNRKGYGGDGLMPKTVAEARLMANGSVSLSKCVRMAAWFARHKPDTQAEGFKDKSSPKYPSAGLVAWLLWGGDSNGSMRAAEWASQQVERFKED